MAVESNYQGFAKSGDNLYIPFYNVQSVSVNIQRIDNADSTGDIFASNVIGKQYYTPDALYKFDTPILSYDFTAANPNAGNIIGVPNLNRSTAAAPVESISGRAIALAGGNLAGGNYTFTRLGGKYFMVPPAVQATDTTGGGAISAQENSGFGWSVAGWIFRSAATAAAFWYIETNVAVTNYIYILINTNGTMSLGTAAAGTLYTTPVGGAVGTGAWNHVVFTYDGANMRFYLNGGLSSGPTARTHQTGLSTTLVRLNHGALGQHYTQSLVVFNSVLTAAQVNRQFNDPTGFDYWKGGVFNQGGTMGQGASMNVIYTNDMQPGQFQSASQPSWVVLPITGIGLLQFLGSSGASYVFEMKVIEKEGID